MTDSEKQRAFDKRPCGSSWGLKPALMPFLYWITIAVTLDWMTYTGILAVVKKTTIDEGPEWAVKRGATLNLTCIIAQISEPHDYVFWYHENQMINYEYSRGEISHQESLEDNVIISRLSIKHVQKQDAGNYTCSPAKAESVSVYVHVISGFEKPEVESDTTTANPAPWSSGPYIVPSFDNATSRNVTAQLGQTAYLHCIVRNLGDKTVSWIRRKPFHVLTVGLEVYTSEDRYQAIHMEQMSDWALQIKYAQQRDAGMYECQVSSDPKISYFVNLTVLIAKTTISEGPEWYVKTGSSINLTCVIAQSPEPPVFVFWYHDNRMINYDSTRGDISLQKAAADMSISRLYIKNVQSQDSGNYTCGPSNAEAASITVNVGPNAGEKTAAMQHDGSSNSWASGRPETSALLKLTTVVIVYFRLFILR